MKPIFTFVVFSGFTTLATHAQMISDTNILNNGTTAAVAMSTSNYGAPTGFVPSNADDLNNSQFFFADYNRGNGNGGTDISAQYLTFSGLTTPTGIGSLRFYDPNNYEIGRVATQVTLYYSTGTLAAGDFTLADYSVANGGNPYVLPVDATTGRYAQGTGSGDTFDTLTGLAIPQGTTSILLDFGPEHDKYGGPTDTGAPTQDAYNVGVGFQEIQAFGGAVASPEPSTWAMIIAGCAGLGLTLRRKLAPVRD